MKKLSTLVGCLLIVRVAVAAPTANEDFVIAEDAQTYTNAVNAANAYTDAATTNLNARPVTIPTTSAGRGVTFTDQYGENQNVAIEIGEGARAAVTTNALEAAADNKVVRSAGVAVGGHAEVRNNADPLKVQGVAVGWHATVSAINGVAIGSGAKHPDDDDATSASAPKAIAIGYNAKASAANAVQLGEGENAEEDTLKFRDVTIVKNGKIQGSIDEDQLLADGFTKMDFSESNGVKRVTFRNDENTFRVVTDTNRADGVALTMGDAEIYGTAAVDSKLAAVVAAIPAPDYSTNNAALVETIGKTAPAPGNYAAVSNAAMNAVQPTNMPMIERYPMRQWGENISIAGDEYIRASTEYHGSVANRIFDGWYLSLSTDFWDQFSDVALSGSYNDLTDTPTIPTNVSAFNNDAGYLTSYTETDPTVPAWAKAAQKPSYTAAEVGAATPEDVAAALAAAATNLVETVIKESTYNLTWDAEAGIMWRKVARNGAFYEQCYTNVNIIVEGNQ